MTEREKQFAQALGNQLRRLRRAKGARLKDVAPEIPTSIGYLSKIETGQKLPRLQVLLGIAEALKMTKKEFIEVIASATEAADLSGRASKKSGKPVAVWVSVGAYRRKGRELEQLRDAWDPVLRELGLEVAEQFGVGGLGDPQLEEAVKNSALVLDVTGLFKRVVWDFKRLLLPRASVVAIRHETPYLFIYRVQGHLRLSGLINNHMSSIELEMENVGPWLQRYLARYRPQIFQCHSHKQGLNLKQEEEPLRS